jgi:hypothetical protein
LTNDELFFFIKRLDITGLFHFQNFIENSRSRLFEQLPARRKLRRNFQLVRVLHQLPMLGLSQKSFGVYLSLRA